MSKFIFVPKSGIKCHFWVFWHPAAPLMPQWYDARIVFFVILEIGDISYAGLGQTFRIRNSGIKPLSALPLVAANR